MATRAVDDQHPSGSVKAARTGNVHVMAVPRATTSRPAPTMPPNADQEGGRQRTGSVSFRHGTNPNHAGRARLVVQLCDCIHLEQREC